MNANGVRIFRGSSREKKPSLRASMNRIIGIILMQNEKRESLRVALNEELNQQAFCLGIKCDAMVSVSAFHFSRVLPSDG